MRRVSGEMVEEPSRLLGGSAGWREGLGGQDDYPAGESRVEPPGTFDLHDSVLVPVV